MDIRNVTSTDIAYLRSNTARITAAGQTGFLRQLRSTVELEETRVAEYLDHLRSKYGNVRIESIPKDQQSLEKVGRGMSGSDVIIAPNVLEKMAGEPETTAYYERKISDYFDAIPRLDAMCAAQGLVHDPGGVVIHEDGSVTYIGGCHDSPERVAQVLAERKAKAEKRAQRQKELLERSQEEAQQRKELWEIQHQKRVVMESAFQSTLGDGTNYFFMERAWEIPSTAAVYGSGAAYRAAVLSQERSGL